MPPKIITMLLASINSVRTSQYSNTAYELKQKEKPCSTLKTNMKV